MIEKNEYGIARWRIDSKEERELAAVADESVEGRSAYVEYYRVNDAEYYNGGVPLLERTLNRFDVKAEGEAKRRIVEDMIYSLHRFGFTFEEYFLLGLEGKTAAERAGFVSDKKRHEYYAVFNTPAGKRLLHDKATTLKRLKPYVTRDFMEVSSQEARIKEIDAFLAKHGDVIVKPVSETCGKGIFLVKAGEMDAAALLSSLSSSDAVIEECICQSPEMAAFHPESINTVRVMSVMCKDGRHFFAPCFRVGRGRSVVDNAGAGGIFASVDLQSGVVVTCGFDEAGRTYVEHPDTGIEFRGFSLPDWDDALGYVGELMPLVPECRCIGWDLAHTNDGWTVVEGNPFPKIVMQQIATGSGLTEEFERFVGLA